MRIIQMRETFEQPRPVGARPRERWEIVAREEIHFQNFVVGVWAAARNFAEEDHLEGVMSGQRLASPVASVIRSPIWSCVGKMRMVPGGSGGGMPGSCGWTGLAFGRLFLGRSLAIQSHAIVTQSISARWYAPRRRLRHGELIATDAESLVHLVLPWLPIPERRPRWTR